MVNTADFKQWLSENTTYSHAVISDIASRAKRADSILEFYNDELYLFYLEKQILYQELSVSVRSQIRKAVKLYFEYSDNKRG